MIKLCFVLAAAAFMLMLTGLSPAQQASVPFDELVREDMFNGFDGDEEAFDRALALCERRLAENPNDAEAMVWHGLGQMFRASRAFLAGGREQGIAFSRQAFDEMAKAITIAPDSPAVLLVRGSTLLAFGRDMPGGERPSDYVQIAMGDLEKALEIQKPYFATLSTHARGELLGALADGWSLLDERERSRTFLARITGELPDTKYAAAATARLDNPADRRPLTCLGCHQR
jgi:hypothetical protein